MRRDKLPTPLFQPSKGETPSDLGKPSKVSAFLASATSNFAIEEYLDWRPVVLTGALQDKLPPLARCCPNRCAAGQTATTCLIFFGFSKTLFLELTSGQGAAARPLLVGQLRHRGISRPGRIPPRRITGAMLFEQVGGRTNCHH